MVQPYDILKKKQNYGDSKTINSCQELDMGDESVEHRGFFRTVMDTCYTFAQTHRIYNTKRKL